MQIDAPTLQRRNAAIARLGVLDRAGDPSLTALTRVAAYVTGGGAAAVHILDDVAQRRIAATGAPLGDHPREDAMCRLVVDSESRIVCADATRDDRFGYSSFVRGDGPVRFYASVPLLDASGVAIGTLCAFDTEEREISEEQVERLTDLAEQAVAQIELMRIAIDLGEVASRDSLTGAVNRLTLGDRLAQAFARRAREGGDTFLALLDIDRFKSINDDYGHDAGDRVLQATVDRLRRIVRPADTIARIGGDEFVLLSELGLTDFTAAALVQRIERALTPPVTLDGVSLPVRTSVGWVLAQPGESIRSVLGRADAAMYRRKAHATREWARAGAGAPAG